MTPNAAKFLEGVLGRDGFLALKKAAERNGALENALVPRAILAWVSLAARTQYEGGIPGLENTYVDIKKSETGYSGGITVGDDVYGFEREGLYHVAASIAVVMGVDHERVPARLRDTDLANLGKSIDLLVKARVVTDDILRKKVLDAGLGYSFSHSYEDHPTMPSTRVQVHAPDGEHVGFATFHHQGDKLVPFGVHVDEDHQRRGIASHMYSLAQKVTGKAVVPGKVQTDEGAALWQGNAQQPQFGLQKKDLPGQTAKPTEAAGPIEPTAPTREQAAPPKPRLPRRPPKPPAPTLPALKLSEKQLTKRCPVCDGAMVKNEKFVGCLCFREMAHGVSLAKNDDGSYDVTFSKPWDKESVEAFLEGVR